MISHHAPHPLTLQIGACAAKKVPPRKPLSHPVRKVSGSKTESAALHTHFEAKPFSKKYEAEYTSNKGFLEFMG